MICNSTDLKFKFHVIQSQTGYKKLISICTYFA